MIAFTIEDGKLPAFYAERRYSQIRRVFATLEVLGGFRGGVTLEVLNADVNEQLGETWHVRTTRRDLQFLVDAGLVVYQRQFDGNCFRLSGHPLNSIAARIPETCDVGRQSGTRQPWRAAG